MKKLIALLLVLVMVVALGTTAFADDAKVGKTVLKVAFNQTITNPEAKTLQKIIRSEEHTSELQSRE